MTKMQRQAEQRRLELVGKQADELIADLRLSEPIDPLAVVRSERPLIRARGGDLGNRYDGKLEYDRQRNLFLLFYNTKYDSAPGRHHPRTRFSIGHELGHYFIEHHHAYLMRAGSLPHRSRSEFRADLTVEREADAFAASLLLPTQMVRPYVNREELTFQRIGELCDRFQTSMVSTAIRAVRLSHFPCAVAGIRQGGVVWMFLSDCMIEAGLYPRTGHLPTTAEKPHAELQLGTAQRQRGESRAADWFNVYNEDRERDYVSEQYVPVTVMNTTMVLLTMDEFEEDDDDDGDED